MGAKYAPSVANLYMAKWEAEGVLGDEHLDIMLYKRFTDDLLIIWKGSMESLMGLLESMNTNDRNISLTWNISRDNIHFLDLEIRNTERGIETKSFFKATDRNLYIPITSCHFRPWLDNISRGQFMRMWKNCTQDGDFEAQADTLSRMFRDKGY